MKPCCHAFCIETIVTSLYVIKLSESVEENLFFTLPTLLRNDCNMKKMNSRNVG